MASKVTLDTALIPVDRLPELSDVDITSLQVIEKNGITYKFKSKDGGNKTTSELAALDLSGIRVGTQFLDTDVNSKAIVVNDGVNNKLQYQDLTFDSVSALKSFANDNILIGNRAKISNDDRDFELTSGVNPEAGNTYQGMNLDSGVSGAYWKVLNRGPIFIEWFEASENLLDNTLQIRSAVNFGQENSRSITAKDGAVFECDVSNFSSITIASRDWIYLALIKSNTIIKGNWTIRISAPGTDLTTFFLSSQTESSIENILFSGITFENTNLSIVSDSRTAGIVFHSTANLGEAYHRNIVISDINLVDIKNGVMFWEDLNGETGLEETWGIHNVNLRGIHAKNSHSAVVWLNCVYNINISDITIDGLSYDIITCHGGENINVTNIAQHEILSASDYGNGDTAVDALNFVVNSSGRNIKNVNVVNCSAYELRANISSSGSVTGTKIENFTVSNCRLGGISAENANSANCTSNGIAVSNCIIDCKNLNAGAFPLPITLRGLYFSQTDDIVVSNCIVKNNRWEGLYARFCDNVTVNGLFHSQTSITDTTASDQSAGVHLDNVKRFNVGGCTIHNVFGPGFYLDNCDFGVIRDSQVQKVDLTGKVGLFDNKGILIDGGADTIAFKGMFLLGGVDSIFMDASSSTGTNYYTSIEFKDITFDSPTTACFDYTATPGTENTDFFGITLSDYRIHGGVTEIDFPFVDGTRGPLLKGGELQVGIGNLLSVTSNTITPTHQIHYIDNTSGAVVINDIVGIMPGAGVTIIPRNTSNNVTMSHIAGNIRNRSGADVILNGPNDTISYRFDGDDWLEVSSA